MRIVILSPHIDDAVLSASTILDRSIIFGNADVEMVRVFNVLGASCYGPHIRGRNRDDENIVTRCRREEDGLVAQLMGFSTQYGDIGDSSVIGISDYEELLADEHQDIRKEDVIKAVSTAVRGADLVVAPLGLGGHVDHRLVHLALNEVLSRPPTIYYAEQPYMLNGMGSLFEWLPRLGGSQIMLRCLSSRQISAKREALYAYRSQFTVTEVDEFFIESGFRSLSSEVFFSLSGDSLRRFS